MSDSKNVFTQNSSLHLKPVFYLSLYFLATQNINIFWHKYWYVHLCVYFVQDNVEQKPLQKMYHPCLVPHFMGETFNVIIK